MAAYRLVVTSALVVLLLLVLAPFCGASTWTIKPDGTGSAPTIQAGIDLAAPGDTVLLVSGTYTGFGNVNVSFNGKAITVRSATGDPTDCIIDCEEGARGFAFFNYEGPTSILEGVTIINGAAYGVFPDYLGGGLSCFQASPTIIRCVFSNCTGFAGGGASCYLSSATFTDCSFFDNTAGDGGGIYFQGNATTVSGCVFAGNHASTGGGLLCGASNTTITNCTFSNNSAGANGSGISCGATTFSLEKTIVSYNTGGLSVECGSGMPTTIECCDVYGNEGGDWVGCLAGQEGVNGNFSGDPMFCDAAGGDYRLNIASSCAPANNSCGVLVGALPPDCGSTIQCPGDESFAVSAHVTFWELAGFVITNTSGVSLSFDYYLDADGPGTLVDNGDPASLAETTPVLAPGQAYFPPEAALEFPHLTGYAEQHVTYHINETGNPGANESCTTTIVFVPSVAVAISAFAARPLNDGVELTWRVAADEAIKGFEIYRKTFPEAGQTRLNPAGLIPVTDRTYFDEDVDKGQVYHYTLLVVAADGSKIRSRVVTVSTKSAALELSQNYPNPFNPATVISFVIPTSTRVALAVYAPDGKLVKRLVERAVGPGASQVVWDGTDERGNRVGSGVYFYRLTAGKDTITKKMVLLK